MIYLFTLLQHTYSNIVIPRLDWGYLHRLSTVIPGLTGDIFTDWAQSSPAWPGISSQTQHSHPRLDRGSQNHCVISRAIIETKVAKYTVLNFQTTVSYFHPKTSQRSTHVQRRRKNGRKTCVANRKASLWTVFVQRRRENRTKACVSDSGISFP